MSPTPVTHERAALLYAATSALRTALETGRDTSTILAAGFGAMRDVPPAARGWQSVHLCDSAAWFFRAAAEAQPELAKRHIQAAEFFEFTRDVALAAMAATMKAADA